MHINIFKRTSLSKNHFKKFINFKLKNSLYFYAGKNYVEKVFL